MDVQVKLYGLFQRYAPGGRNEIQLELPPGATVEELLERLKIPLDMGRVLLVNGRRAGAKSALAPGDAIVIFPPLNGG